MDCKNGTLEYRNQGGGRCVVQKDSKFVESERMWTEVTLNKEDLSYMFDEATPVKACGDLAYHVNNHGIMNKESEELRDASSQHKRRRMLQFDSQVVNSHFCNDEITNAFLRSNETEDSLEEVLPQLSQWASGFSDVSASDYGVMDHESERWLAECINDTDMLYCNDDMNFSGVSDVQIDVSDLCNEPPLVEANLVQKCVPRTPRNIVVKGRKSFISTPTKVPSSVTYPFAFVKPCGMSGDVTLKDINQRIRTPPPSKAKQHEVDPTPYPTSAFSGKPVVGKTKIRTEGGKGSITIMRTKG